MLSKDARKALIGWIFHRSGIIETSFKTRKKGITRNVIQCYASTNDNNDDDKGQFYEKLQSITAKCPAKDLTILNGDLNAEFAMENMGYEDTMG
ncbi:unnamed protein product [Schistosoma margrebowiei]|uniref:Endonuclease/exonuclease/phosphatase domain-containing protein n=1 Tax=Schistosoma margrebowiei TaxID=48269 RepID=A0A183N711_9TREM|nr:unnamed protein product [Schistosoma margrebowiei]VDP49884.1 unnamed protein product [Schistosoma margrebowiei]